MDHDAVLTVEILYIELESSAGVGLCSRELEGRTRGGEEGYNIFCRGAGVRLGEAAGDDLSMDLGWI